MSKYKPGDIYLCGSVVYEVIGTFDRPTVIMAPVGSTSRADHEIAAIGSPNLEAFKPLTNKDGTQANRFTREPATKEGE